MDLYFVYELSYKGIVFYVGQTIAPFQRYSAHCTGDIATWCIINLIREKGDIFEFKIVYICDTERQSLFRERSLIELYVKLKIALCNCEYNPKENQITYYYRYDWRVPRKKLNHDKIKEYITNAIDKYRNGQFRYECMGYSASIG
jgi:hypothetical protein